MRSAVLLEPRRFSVESMEPLPLAEINRALSTAEQRPAGFLKFVVLPEPRA